MFGKSSWQSKCAAVMAIGITAGSIAPLVASAPALAQSNFYDVSSNYWAAEFIQELARRDVIAGFPDGSFRPEQPVTRAQFAAMIRKAFQKAPERRAVNFNDVSRNYWAYGAIQEAYTTGFLSGYPGNRFAPNQNIPREQVLVSLANGLDYSPSNNSINTLQYYNDSFNISNYARRPIAAATEKQIVVNYPNVQSLNPKATATRAQVAAFIYQALVSNNQASAISSPYIVAFNSSPSTPVAVTIPAETVIPVKYDKAEKILVTKDETAPLTLTVSQNVITDRGDIVIPAGSQVIGELKPAEGGSQFVAQKLVLTSGQEYSIDANSEVITKTETVKKGSRLRSTIKNAALGAGAAAAIAGVTGDRAIATEEVLGGAAVGSLVGLFFGKKSVDLIVIDPDTDLQMTIEEQFEVSLR
ncbi:MAG: S-layer homology domain-containing protein [Mastigocoleus sp. MO_167.B18]|uniref:S-layer homology domain-containing protein n=1 Tax=Mastigocoleus sp. MO_188.B34 TaxID=3036635 RepID=UPI00262EAD70|nr:S-layer homology domain-containing protein [Mastigocoleus sp. MO_188.B34]MDJ0695339.1 S-layer homology domain-containing protein [Mastigocoleus sp. MO_188.B34]MDJ0772293.1 S-layer homology domain-containing protein [Mastigocoleus sp. MO_167.B18]